MRRYTALMQFWHGGQLFINHLNYIGMCKIKQLNGEAPKYNNYCTSREYEVFCMIAKDDNFKVGDLIDGEKLSNKTIGRIWEITECNRVDGGHVTIKDNKGNVKTCMFVFGKGTQKPQPKPQPQITKEEETTTSETTKTDETMNTQVNNNGIEQVANIFASLQNEAYNKGYKVAQDEAAAKIDDLTAQVEELKNKPTTSGTVINITIDGKKTETKVNGIVNPKFARILKYLANGENVYMYGPAGTGKNVTAKQCAEALDMSIFYNNTIYTKYDLCGYMDANGQYVPTTFYNFMKAPKGLYFMDEYDNSQSSALVCFNDVLEDKKYTFPNGETLYLDENHKIIAAGNTNGQGATEEYNDRYVIDESNRSRFMFVSVTYDPAVEKSIVGESNDILDFINDLRRVRDLLNIKLILGYREIKRLKTYEDDDDLPELFDNMLLKGMEQDTINEIAARLEGATKWHKAFKSLVK